MLLFLIQKEELDIVDVALQKLTEQFTKKLENLSEIDRGSEWLALTATLLLLKSRKLIPGEEVPEEELPRIEIFQKLLEYCRFKEAALALAEQAEKQRFFFSRGKKETPKRSALGIEELALEDLTSLLKTVMARAPKTGVIVKEQWEVAPLIEWLRAQVAKKPLLFEEIFHESKCKEELIVSFLALLELMKLEEVRVIKKERIYVESTRS